MKPCTQTKKFRLAVTTPCLITCDNAAGPAFELCRKLLLLNHLPGIELELVLVSRNGGINNLAQHLHLQEMGITAGPVLVVADPVASVDELEVGLYLTDDAEDVRRGREKGIPAAQIHGSASRHSSPECLSVSFDYDHVLADTSASTAVLKATGDLGAYAAFEDGQADIPHEAGPLHQFFLWLGHAKEVLATTGAAGTLRQIKLAIVTWRSGRSARRVQTSLSAWAVRLDELHLLAGINKTLSLQRLAPDLFIDDNIGHITEPSASMLCAHIPQLPQKAASKRSAALPTLFSTKAEQASVALQREIVAIAAAAFLSSGFAPYSKERFEPALQRHLHAQARQAGKSWQRELATAADKNSRIDLAIDDCGSERAVKGFVEVKVMEQYRRQYFGHLFPVLFMNSLPGTPAIAASLLQRKMLDYGWDPDEAARQETLQRYLAACTCFREVDGETRFRNVDEGSLLHDFVKMLKARENTAQAAIFSLLCIMTYPDSQAWDHVHEQEVAVQRLGGLFRSFHDVACRQGKFSVDRGAGGKPLTHPYRPFAVNCLHRDLGLQSWQRGGETVTRKVSILCLGYDLAVDSFALSEIAVDSAVETVPHREEQAVAGSAQKFRYGVFDLETIRSAREVGGWNNADKMGVSVGVVYDSADGKFYSYFEDQVGELIDHLKRMDLVVGFNSQRFDYKVLSAYAGDEVYSLPTFDLCRKLVRSRGWKCDLNTLAHHTLGAEKSANGLLALQWYKEGRLAELEHYCRKDVELTRDLFLHALEKGYVYGEAAEGQRVECAVKVGSREAAMA